ncbi:hypothetical protein JCM14036_25140 [Desulfotomaculum defluvii]
MDKEDDVTQNRWPTKENALTAKERYKAFRENCIVPTLKAWGEYRHEHLINFVLPAVEIYNQRKRESSWLNFQDLLMLAAALLRDNAEVRQYFQKRFSHLLVDEFQDTDPIQVEIMLYLAGADTTEKDWRKLMTRQGSLFMVGDPKQAIYRTPMVLRQSPYRSSRVFFICLTKEATCSHGFFQLQLLLFISLASAKVISHANTTIWV